MTTPTPEPTPTPTREDNKNSNTTNPSNRNARRTNFCKHKQAIGLELRTFTTETPELDAVLSLLSEKVEKGVTFDVFQKRLENYMLKNLPRAEDITKLITALEDPTERFEELYGPANLTTTKAANVILFKK